VLPLWLFFGIFIELPAWVVVGEFFLVNLYDGFGAVGRGVSTGVAFFAHVGGFVAGLVLVRLFLDEPRGRDHARCGGFRPPAAGPHGPPGPPRRVRADYPPPPPPHRPWDG
jgi:hypothetical protein